MSEWVDISERLPDVIRHADGSISCVLVKWIVAPECGSEYMVANSEWVCGRGRNQVARWMEIPE